MNDMIGILQLIIWVIVALMVFLVYMYFTIIAKSQNKNNYDSNNNKFENEYYKNQYDDGLNSEHEDDGPIQNL